MKVGRNDPCPCGSGKKYKKCCIDKENNIIQFPGTNSNNIDDMMKEYELYCENAYNLGGEIPTFNQYFNIENEASSFLNLITDELQGSEFESMEEFEIAAQNLMEEKNAEPLDDLLGLSPNQMNNILKKDLIGNKNILTLNKIKSSNVSSTLIIEATKLFLNQLLETNGSTNLTGTRSINSTFCTKFLHSLLGLELTNKPIKESDSLLIPWIRDLLLLGGYTTELKTRIKITDKGKELLKKNELHNFYMELFIIATDKLDWFLGTDDNEILFIQDSIIFSLYVIDHLKNEKFSIYDFFTFIETAFPFMDEEKHGFIYKLFFLDNFCVVFGLLDPLPQGNDFNNMMYTTTELFDKLFNWKL